jgi:mannose-6-phosphate isomerase-like protein (cupin superfamily)
VTPPTDRATGFVIATHAGHLIELPAWTMHVQLSAEQTDGHMTLIYNRMEAFHRGPLPHIHTGHDEAFFVIEGSLELRLGDVVRTAGVGETAFAGRGLAHGFANPNASPAVYLLMLTPSGYEDYFEKVARHFAATGDMPDRAVTARLMAEHHTTMVEPLAWR